MTLPNADQNWVNLWVERYNDGKKEDHPIAQLSYGDSPNNLEEGRLGFGMINHELNDPFIFIYGPSVKSQAYPIQSEGKTGVLLSWSHAIGDKEVELEIGEEEILAVYRETESNSIQSVDFQNE